MPKKQPTKAFEVPHVPAGPSVGELRQLHDLTAEYSRRQIEALRLYEPLPWQQTYHESRATEKLVIGGNRSGKSLCTFAEDARALCGCDPFDKYPKQDGILAIVAQGWKQIGMVVYPMLFKNGAFRVIKDQATGKWRAWRPWEPEDKAREAETKPSRPLIPRRLVKEMSFLNKKERHISSFEMVNGWKCYVFSADGEVPMGFQANRIHFDEDIQNPSWIDEMQARLSDRKGCLDWSATPTTGNDAMLDMSIRAEKQEQEVAERSRPRADVVQFRFRFTENPFIDLDEKRKRLEAWAAAGEDVLAKREGGEFTASSSLMYPTFHMDIHGLNRVELPAGQVPHDWCRYAFTDPGHQVAAVLFVAVPPAPSDYVLLYDELYIKQANASMYGQKMHEKTFGQSLYAFVIDAHGGRLKDIGAGRSVKQQYSEALRERGVSSQITGHGFIDGCDDIPARAEAVRRMLQIRPCGTPRLRILRGSCPNLEWELRRYRKKVGPHGMVLDEPNTRGPVHLCQCLEYMAAYDPRFHVSKLPQRTPNWVKDYLSKKRKRAGYGAPSTVVLGHGS